MAGSSGLKLEHRVLRALAGGPCTHVDLRRELGWSVWGQHKALQSLLGRMRIAGMVEPVPGRKGTWRLVDGLEVCEHCHGKGLVVSPSSE